MSEEMKKMRKQGKRQTMDMMIVRLKCQSGGNKRTQKGLVESSGAVVSPRLSWICFECVPFIHHPERSMSAPGP